MNFLAHIYLSGDSDEIILGNFIGDFVKGNKFRNYPEMVAFGIQLHRNIDAFTDSHPDVRKCIDMLKPAYGRHSGIVADVFFDHFLASNWNQYSQFTLREFAKHAHAVFLSNFLILPFRVKQFLPFLIQHKRLESYARKESMLQVLQIMSRHSSLPSNAEKAMEILDEHYVQFDGLFRSFFQEMVAFVETDFGIKISKPELNSEKLLPSR